MRGMHASVVQFMWHHLVCNARLDVWLLDAVGWHPALVLHHCNKIMLNVVYEAVLTCMHAHLAYTCIPCLVLSSLAGYHTVWGEVTADQLGILCFLRRPVIHPSEQLSCSLKI